MPLESNSRTTSCPAIPNPTTQYVNGFEFIPNSYLETVLPGWLFLKAVLDSSVTTTAIDKVALIRCRANTATVTCIGRTTALGLALVILKHKEIVGAEVEWGIVAL